MDFRGVLKMGKEIKIGLAVILALLVVFGVVLVQRLRNPADATEAAAEEGADQKTADTAKPAATQRVSTR